MDLDHQGVDWGLSIPDALDLLLAGCTDSDAEYAGNAYNSALQHIIDHSASDPYQLGTFSKPSTFFGLVDDEMRRLGVPADLLPHGYLYGGLPDDFPYIPHSIDGYPAIGHLPLAKTKLAAAVPLQYLVVPNPGAIPREQGAAPKQNPALLRHRLAPGPHAARSTWFTPRRCQLRMQVREQI
ncbi:DUF7691 family protein [Streptomyces avermitilis]|uniref:DUF7691 domain-containing protein n=1 Tax=Streptomyces avermitilis TaxID=33903 RepID=A0A4D4MFM0_STRAX|nr:hypothetical protein [Streptomyces avermitilis]GDY68822.1 hypothetical protein SAV14893_082150 [Streptomyces avermitilis]GDY70792.1 hypothetical protein SAV31267_002770 [Streptomyces avermitilis]